MESEVSQMEERLRSDSYSHPLDANGDEPVVELYADDVKWRRRWL